MAEDASELNRLIELAKGGSEDALGRLCTHYRPYLRLLANSTLSTAMQRRAEASDIVQITELDAARAIQEFRGSSEAEFTGWLQQILRRNVSDVVRDNRAGKRDIGRERQLDAASSTASITWYQPAANQDTPSQCVMNGEAALHLAQALELLPVDQREAVRLRHIEGLKLAEIGKVMGKSEMAVAGLLRRGLKAMREHMGNESRFL